MSSPLHSTEHDAKDSFGSGSPSRSNSRYSDRIKRLVTDSPLRDPVKTPERTTTTYPSPLRRNNANSDKYSAFEIKNEDRGEWRESSLTEEAETKQVEIKEQITNEEKPSEKIPERQQTTEKRNTQKKSGPDRVPHYMQGTRAFESRLNSKKDGQKHKDILKPRSGGGITKQVGTPKVSKHKSTAAINVIKEIKNEMTTKNAYIPMAAQIKLFEKDLGNASNKSSPLRPTATRSSAKVKSSSSESKAIPINRSSGSRQTQDSSIPSYARKTIATLSRSNSSSKLNNSRQGSENKQKKEPKNIKVKPFRFATSERAQQHKESFDEKSKLEKSKQTEQSKGNKQNGQIKRGIKRKLEHNSAPTSKKQA
ncbi:hypothetical protein G6F37_009771 [Rhizopus arrhizus]|nr:hypothetical protein G6F38_001863 [Rhizopus arrhizus]KAG1154086.1 hypothetical protein G6F37_009771 [Rhizopus arrhizus]